MSKPVLFRVRVRIAAKIRHFVQRAEGIAAVEFALIVPIMAALFMGAVEMSQAVTANRRVTQVGSTAGDLVARYNGNISETDLKDMMKVSSYLLEPFKIDGSRPLKVEISVVSSTSVSATDTKEKWKCTYDTSISATNVSCTCPNSVYTLPATGMLTTSDSIVVTNVTYSYKPNLFDVYMKSAYGGVGGVYKMTEKVYLKPRAACPKIDITTPSATTCGC
jgi:Flp pilus assembly protein TadG